MKSFTWVWRLAVLLVVVSLMIPLTGCEGDEDNNDSPAVNITGTWDEVYVGTDATGSWTEPGTMILSQSGSAVSGTYSNVGGDNTGTVSGSVMGNAVAMSYSPNNTSTFDVYTVAGVITGNTGSGTWVNSSTGFGGTWMATKR